MNTEPEIDLLINRAGSGWRSPEVREYTDEAHLQDLLAQQPGLLPGVPPHARAVTELLLTDGSKVDVVTVAPQGDLAVVECKLASNPEMRRSVIGQVLAYASGLWRMGLEDFERAWGQRSGGRSLAESVLGPEHADDDAQALHTGVAERLRDGRFTLILAVDAITPELRRIVEYLNAKTVGDVSVLAQELRYAREGDVEIIVPRVFGAELAGARDRARSPKRQFTEQDFLQALAEAGPKATSVGTRLLDRFRDEVDHFTWGVGVRPNATAVFTTSAGEEFKPWSIWASGPAWIYPNFEYTRVLPHTVREAFLADIAAIPGAIDDAEAVRAAGLAKRPGISIEVLAEADHLDRFIAAVAHLIAAGSPARERVLGADRGRVGVAEDFDAPLPDGFSAPMIAERDLD